jgi:C-terminal processing protease CtpA/Prc
VLEANGPQFKRVRVHGVVLGSPAEKSGLQEGDIIIAIDGELTDNYALWQIQGLVKKSGRTRKLTIHRRGQTMDVTLELESLA